MILAIDYKTLKFLSFFFFNIERIQAWNVWSRMTSELSLSNLDYAVKSLIELPFKNFGSLIARAQ